MGESSARPRGIAVWGLGRHAMRRVIPAIAATPRLSLVGVCSRDAATVAQCSTKWRCRGWTDPAPMLADPRVEIVYLATPIGVHADLGTRVLRAGKHLWCEKPLTTDRPDTESLIEIARHSGLSVCEAHMFLHHPHFKNVRSLLADGAIGSVLSVHCVFGIPPLDHPGFRLDPALGGGALLDVGCYTVAATCGLFPTSAVAVRGATRHTRRGAAVDTDGTALLALDDGITATLEWHIAAGYRSHLSIWGDEGSLATERIFSKEPTEVASVDVRDLHGRSTATEVEPADHFALMLQAFERQIGDRPAMEAEWHEIARRAAVLSAIRSAAS